jgi:hypothetical protein
MVSLMCIHLFSTGNHLIKNKGVGTEKNSGINGSLHIDMVVWHDQ